MTSPLRDPAEVFAEIHDLAHSLFDGEARYDRWERLEELLDDELACRLYVQYMHETAALRQILREEVAQQSEPPRPLPGSARTKAIASRESSGAALASSRPARPWKALLASAGAGLLAGLLLFAAGLFVVSGRPAPEGASRVSERVAKITHSVGAEWSRDGRPAAQATGDWLGAGRYTLREGIATLVFPWGTEVTLEGPTEVEFAANGDRQLLSGQLVAKVSPEDTGFTINTPTVEVVDLGTEFGLSAETSGKSEVHVFKGAVEARPRFGDKTALATSIRLSTGEANSFVKEEASARQIIFNPRRFSKAWRASSHVAETSGALQFQHPPPASVVEGRTESNETLLLFLEAEGVPLLESTAVTLTQPGLYTTFADRSARLPAGLQVDSYLVHFDPSGSKHNQPPVALQGAVTFDRPIMGIIVRGDQLAASDAVLGYPGTRYVAIAEYDFSGPIDDGYFTNRPPPYAIRGLTGLWDSLDLNDSPAPNDWLRLSADRRTLTLRLAAGGEANQLRVLVAATDEADQPSLDTTPPQASRPFRGRPFHVGETIEAEDFDLGGDGIAYYDRTFDALANVYRTSESIELLSYIIPGRTDLAVGMARPGEWLVYSVLIDEPGRYVIKARTRSGSGEGGCRFEFGEKTATPLVRVPKTAAARGFPTDCFETIASPPIGLEAGPQTMRVVFEASNDRALVGAFDWFRIERVAE